MKHFELWLDESGNFVNEYYDSKIATSLVGGILLEKGAILQDQCYEALGTNYVHSCEMEKTKYSKFAIPVLKKVTDNGGSLVIFENKERLKIVDGDTTYLNVLSEGIIQLMRLLKLKYGHIKLHVIIAVRKAIDRTDYKNRHIIDRYEYIKRLQEKIILGLARKSIISINNKAWSLELQSARKDVRLMLADVVCHSWFARDKKFDQKQKEIINSLYSEEYIFSVFCKEEEYINILLNEGNIGEAIFEIFTIENTHKEEYLKIIINRFKEINNYSRDSQLKILVDKLKSLLLIDIEYSLVISILQYIQVKLIPKMQLNELSSNIFFMDISLLLLTAATHQGNLGLAEEQIRICDSIISSLVSRWESLDYYFIYRIRKSIHQLNSYDIHGCIDSMNELDRLIEGVFSFLPIADGLSELCNEIKSDIRGKILGTRLQARLLLINKESIQLDLARKDSDEAIKQFQKISDLSRQYQYRCRIEYESGNYVNALVWLFDSLNLTYKNDKFSILLKNVLKLSKKEAAFTIMHYVTIMAGLKESGDSQADEMYDSWKLVGIDKYILENEEDEHPYEIILWKLATYIIFDGDIQGSMDKYDKAIAIAIANTTNNNITLKAIALGIKINKAGMLIKIKHCNEEISKVIDDAYHSYFEFMNFKLPLSMTRHFLKWKPIIKKIKNFKEDDNLDNILIKMSKQIFY